MSSSSAAAQQKNLLNPRCYYKTQLCRAFMEKPNGCPSGWHCGYAHGHHELRIAQVPTYKTKPCHRLFKNGFCQYGGRCIFIHPADSLTQPRVSSNSPKMISSAAWTLPSNPTSSSKSSLSSSSSSPSPTPSSPLSTDSTFADMFDWSPEGKKPEWMSSWLKDGLASALERKDEPFVVENDVLLDVVESVLQEDEENSAVTDSLDWDIGSWNMKDGREKAKPLGAFGLQSCWFS